MASAKLIVITGASDGIGAAAARRLHGLGHRVVVIGRSPEKTRAVAAELGADHFVVDFCDLTQVRDLAGKLDAGYERIDVLANNAGGIFGDEETTVDGHERTFQVNHLAPFLLTTLLTDKLIASAATVVQTSSVAARLARRPRLDDLDRDGRVEPIRAYFAAKLENILFTLELHRRYQGRGLAAVAFHPGAVASSFGTRSSSRLMRVLSSAPPLRARLASPHQGASQLVWFADSTARVDWQPGRYYENHRPARLQGPSMRDAGLARGLWERSEQLLAAMPQPR